MAHILSSFHSPNAGILEIVFQGVFYQGRRRDAGFPSGSTSTSPANLMLRAFVGPPEDRTYTQAIDRYAPTVIAYAYYPGGDVEWPFGTQELDWTKGSLTGIWSFGFEDLRIDITLRTSSN